MNDAILYFKQRNKKKGKKGTNHFFFIRNTLREARTRLGCIESLEDVAGSFRGTKAGSLIEDPNCTQPFHMSPIKVYDTNF